MSATPTLAEVITEAIESRLLDEMVTTAPDGDWQDRTLSLQAWSGQRVSLELVTENDTGFQHLYKL